MCEKGDTFMAKKSEKKKGLRMDMRFTLILFALIPLLVSVIVVSVVLVKKSSNEVKVNVSNAMVSSVVDVGTAFDYSTEMAKTTMRNFASAPIIMDALKNPTDADIAAKAEAYTQQFFGNLEGWEGIYLADWNSQVLTHPAPPVVGKVMREGDRLAELQNAMLAAEDGVYNVGIIESPASGELIMSMYMPIFEDGTPLGYVGCGTFVNTIAANFSDVSELQLSSAYIYFVAPDGIMLYHPTPEKIGQPVENEAVKGLIAKLDAGEHPTPKCVEYKYKGAMKYAAYYIDDAENYIAVLTADESDVLSAISDIVTQAVLIAIVCIIAFVILVIFISRAVSKPLKEVAAATEQLSTGDVTAECNAKSHIVEIQGIVKAYDILKKVLNTSMTEVKQSAGVLNSAIVSVDDMTNNNVDSISQINNAINEVASTSQSVAESAQNMAEKAADLGANIEVLNDNITSLHNASLTIREVNNEASDCMKSVYDGANESVTAVKAISEKISETNAAIEGIERAVQAIETIASQTNLLSLNASIEAARAGEAGAGFAVVAAEIRTLADSSAESAKEIKKIIGDVAEMSQGTVEISNKVFEVINKEQSDIENAQAKFNTLSDSVEASIAEIDTIKDMAGKLDEIKMELTNSTADLGAISEELGATAEEVAASCHTVTESCADTQVSTGEMRTINENMRSAIEFFKL